MQYRIGRCENVKLWKMYFLQMNFVYTHKNKIDLEKIKKIKNAHIFAKMILKKAAASLKVQNLI